MTHCLWRIEYRLGDILERVLTPQDEEYLKWYNEQLREDFNNRLVDSEEIYVDS